MAASCFNHPDSEALDCRRCGSFFCAACLSPMGFCSPCALKQRPSALAITGAVLGAAGCCLFVPAPFAIVIGLIEQRRIRQHHSPAQSADFARAAITLGVFGLLLGALVRLVLVPLLH